MEERSGRKNKKRYEELKEIKLIEKVFKDSKRTYGYRKIWEALRQNGYEISLYRIRRIMRENGFYSETQKKYKPSRKGEVIGYEISKKIDTELVKRALGNAIARNGISENLIFHSDYAEENTMPKNI